MNRLNIMTKDVRDKLHAAVTARNAEFVAQEIRLPSGVRFTMCKPSHAFAVNVDLEQEALADE